MQREDIMASVLIFGATGSIGRALSHRLSASGTPLHLAGRNETELSELASSVNASYSVFDAYDTSSISQAVDSAAAEQGLAGVVWAVGNILLKPLSALKESDFTDCYHLNLIGAAMAAQASHAQLRKSSGSLVMFSSVAATTGFTAHAAIASAKAAVEGLGKSLAAEWAPDVRVNVIAPSLTHSKMAAPIVGNEQMAKALAATHPLGRLGIADDSAAMAEFLLSPAQSGWITGQIMAVDGGRSTLQTAQRSR